MAQGRAAGGRLIGALGVLAAFAALPAAAQPALSLPDPRDTLREARPAPPRPGPLAPLPDIRFTSQAPPPGAEDLRFRLDRLDLDGATVHAPGALDPIWADRLGTEISVADLFALAAAVQARYRADGYLFTRVLVPAQRIEDGTARLQVVEAVIGRVAIEEPGLPIGPVKALAERITRPLEGLRNPRADDLERVLLLLDDIPGITRAAAVPRLGEGPGEIDLFVNMEREALGWTVFADNRQSPVIGPGLVGAVAAINSWSPAGDSTQISGFVSAGLDDSLRDELRERWTLQIDHRRVLTPWGLELRGSALHSRTRPGGDVADFDITGEQSELGLSLFAPLHRTRALRLDLTAGFEGIDVDTRTPLPGGPPRLSRDRLRVATLALDAVRRDGLGAFEGRAQIRHGLSALGASGKGDPDLSRSDGDGAFWSLRAELARDLTLPAGFSLHGRILGQWADRALLSSEEMTAGGAVIGRGFHPSEITGDAGYGGTMELRYSDVTHLGAWRTPYELYGFADRVRVRNLDGGAPARDSVFSAGLGVRAQLPGRFAVNFEAAKPINRPLAYTQSSAWRFLFSAAKEF